MKTQLTILAVLAACSVGVATAGDVTGLTTFTSGTKAVAAEVNGNFTAVKTAVDDNNSRITTNTADIATNTGNITTNTGNIATNAADIAANTAADAAATDDLCTLYQLLAGSGTVGVLPIPAGCPPSPRTVFVTSTDYTGDLGGLAGADAKCMTQATAGGLTGTFKAWLSDGTASPATRFTQSTDPYMLADGTTMVATDWADLTDGTLTSPINLNESAQQLTGNQFFPWTGTDEFGVATNPIGCNNWTSAQNTIIGIMGHALLTTGWANNGGNTCDQLRTLYCFQQ